MNQLRSSFIARLFWSRRSVTLVVTLLISLVSSIQAVAQNATGRIIGTVSDEQGAAVPGAKVVVTNTDTNVRWETVTGTDGAYQVLNVPIGNYSVTVEHEGFTKAVSSPQIARDQSIVAPRHPDEGRGALPNYHGRSQRSTGGNCESYRRRNCYGFNDTKSSTQRPRYA